MFTAINKSLESLQHFKSRAFKSSKNHVRPNTLYIIGQRMTSAITLTITKTHTKTNTKTKMRPDFSTRKSSRIQELSYSVLQYIYINNIRCMLIRWILVIIQLGGVYPGLGNLTFLTYYRDMVLPFQLHTKAFNVLSTSCTHVHNLM